MVAVGHGTDRQPGPEPPTADEATPQRWSSEARILLAAAVVVLILGAAAVAVIVADPHRLGMAYSGAPDGAGPDGTGPDGAGSSAGAAEPTGRGGVAPGGDGAAAVGQTMTAPLAGRRQATFVLVDGLSSFDLRVADLGDDLYRISSPAGSGVVPRPAVLGERVQLGVVATGTSGERAVRVHLNERVDWRLHLSGGVSSQVLDLTRARLLGMELGGGSSRTELLLPPLNGTTTVRLTAGTSQLDVRVPGEPPVRVRVGTGAGSVVVRDERWAGVAAGALLSTPGWDRSADRLYLDLVAGASSVTVASSTR
ncbi:cell wall-active antibiotics response protein [Micromonospora sp. RHAY321]|uniref:cell wall-active antibiotics response protein n=1 Tax=Micromonospora sp. RHAY321 TaxID=2944807 RepID=UPI00207D23BB|nr:cell wall-active antibiotics response protein [Micromonospora sp. RHAY321]MCO1594303.1 cell wall-active antibiotics response protein [Micromonospora sp. RHAY321]